jgi:hypothetical protein
LIRRRASASSQRPGNAVGVNIPPGTCGRFAVCARLEDKPAGHALAQNAKKRPLALTMSSDQGAAGQGRWFQGEIGQRCSAHCRAGGPARRAYGRAGPVDGGVDGPYGSTGEAPTRMGSHVAPCKDGDLAFPGRCGAALSTTVCPCQGAMQVSLRPGQAGPARNILSSSSRLRSRPGQQ